MEKKFKDIRSLDDIQKRKRKLAKKLRRSENSLTEKADIGKILLNSTESLGSFFGRKSMPIEDLEYLLPLGFKYISKLVKSKPDKKYLKRFSIFFAIGSILALSSYQYLKKREDQTIL